MDGGMAHPKKGCLWWNWIVRSLSWDKIGPFFTGFQILTLFVPLPYHSSPLIPKLPESLVLGIHLDYGVEWTLSHRFEFSTTACRSVPVFYNYTNVCVMYNVCIYHIILVFVHRYIMDLSISIIIFFYKYNIYISN